MNTGIVTAAAVKKTWNTGNRINYRFYFFVVVVELANGS